MAFPVASRTHTIDAHGAPPHRRARLWSAGRPVVRQPRASAPHARAGPHASRVAAGERIVHRDSSARGARWRHPSTRAGGAARPPAAAWIGADSTYRGWPRRGATRPSTPHPRRAPRGGTYTGETADASRPCPHVPAAWRRAERVSGATPGGHRPYSYANFTLWRSAGRRRV